MADEWTNVDAALARAKLAIDGAPEAARAQLRANLYRAILNLESEATAMATPPADTAGERQRRALLDAARKL